MFMFLFRPNIRVSFLCLVTIILCITVHELGHVLAGWATGGRVTRFVLLSVRPHVRVQGKSTPAQMAVKAAGGSGLFMTVWLAMVALFPKARKYWVVVEVSFIFALIEGLAWLLYSSFFPHGQGADDVSKFIRYSGISPIEVAAAWAGIAMFSTFFFQWKRAQIFRYSEN
jgi:hypothetical protein